MSSQSLLIKFFFKLVKIRSIPIFHIKNQKQLHYNPFNKKNIGSVSI